MKLISCHVDNFGTLHNFDMAFEEGLNVVLHENGWGKSTLAAFLKAMLYGYDNKRSKSLSENDRKHYKPWQGGKYGGTLTFEKGGSRYMVMRTFGETARFDTVSLRNLDTGRNMHGVENVGEWLFKLDADAFKRSAFIYSNQLNSGNSGLSFHARLNAVLGEAGDVGAFDEALAQIVKRTKDYEKTGNRGYIAEVQKKIDELLVQQKAAKESIARVEAMRVRISELDEDIGQADAQIAALKKRLDAEDSEKKEREAAQKLYKQLKDERESLKKELATLLKKAGGVIPAMEELQALKQNRSETNRILESLGALKAQKQKEIDEIQARYDGLLAREAALEEEEKALLAEGPVPEEEEIRRVRQGRQEINRMIQALDALTAEDRKKFGEIQTQYDALLDQQTALEEALDEALSGLGGCMPQKGEIQNARINLEEIEKLSESILRIGEKKAELEQTLYAMEHRYGGRLPGAGEFSGILQTQKAWEEAFCRLQNGAHMQEELLRAQKVKAETDVLFANELPDKNTLAEIRRSMVRADGLKSEAAGLEAQAYGERTKMDSLESALRQWGAASSLSQPSAAKPKAAGAVGAFIGAGILAVLGIVLFPLLLAGAVLLAVLGGVLLIRTNKQREEYEKNRRVYEEERRKAEEKRDALEAELDLARRSHKEKTEAAAIKRAEAEELANRALSYLQKWNGAVLWETAAGTAETLLEKLEARQRAEGCIASLEGQTNERIKAERELRLQLEAKRKLLPEDTSSLPLEERVSAAEKDGAQAWQLKADLKAAADRLEEQEQKRNQRTKAVSDLLTKCKIPLEEAKIRLAELEKKAEAAAEAKQKLEAHQKRVADFEKANRSVLAPSGQEERGSAAGQLKLQLASLQKSVAEVLKKYPQGAEGEEAWAEASEKRLEKKKEIEQNRELLEKQIEDFEEANKEALTGKSRSADEASAQGKLEKQLRELEASVRKTLEKYGVSKEEEASWTAAFEQYAAMQDEILQRLGALEKQTAAFEQTHKKHLTAGETFGASSPLEEELQRRATLREALMKERTQAEDAIGHADETLDSYRTIVSRLRILGEEKQKAQGSLYVLKKSAEYLKAAKENLASRYMGQIEYSFNRYFAAWVQQDGIRGLVDGDFNVTMDENGSIHEAEGYSTGYCDVIDFCMRMALIDTLFEEERPFIIMDDPFVNLDARRLQHAMGLLKSISAESQIIYFVCHEVRASEPALEEMPEIARQGLIKSAPKAAKPKAEPKKARFILKEERALEPLSQNRRITNSIFTLGFAPAEGNMGSGEYELFFADENEKVLCDRQQLSLVDGEVIPEKVRFCLNTGSASGKQYYLYIRKAGAPENEIVQKIPYASAIVFAADFDF